jgi:endonuclease/exonuclease/phosphatase family metal-dependent hydrolase
MDYTPLRRLATEDRQRIVAGLKKLRAGLANHIPSKGPGSLLLATWNIREFGGAKYGGRLEDARFFIAECLAHFDLVAVQEVRRDLTALRSVMRLLGPQWDVVFTDVSYADGGNSERLAFLFDKNQVTFTGLAGELVLPPEASKTVVQVARTPFVCGFQAGWAKFNLCTVHIYYGEGDENPRRVEEIRTLTGLLAKKAKDYINTDRRVMYSPENLLVLGDFNIAKHTHKTFQALTESGFIIPDALQRLPGTNVAKDKFYDQIAFYKATEGIVCRKADVFDFYEYVFNDEAIYAKQLEAAGARSFKDWRTYQMSDHLIMWSLFDVDKTDAYLEEVANATGDDPRRMGAAKTASKHASAASAAKRKTATPAKKRNNKKKSKSANG